MGRDAPSRGPKTVKRREAFEAQAGLFAGRSELYERLAHQLADDPRVAALIGDDVGWREPLQLFSGLHYLVLSDRASWEEPQAALSDEEEFLREWLARELVQTNEVRRCWLLLPCFLEIARRTGAAAIDCVELGCSAGLNLLWDRYGSRYANGAWPGPLQLGGEERAAVPADLLALRPRVRSRVGVDLDPPDLHTEEGVRLLKSFIWAGQDERLDLLDRAVAIWRENPPEIVVGDLVDELPSLLDRRRDDTLLIVWETATLGYLPDERRDRVGPILASAGKEAPLAFVHSGSARAGGEGYSLVVQIWPDGSPSEVAYGDFHGAWMEWVA
jgi:hypothetical protein